MIARFFFFLSFLSLFFFPFPFFSYSFFCYFFSSFLSHSDISFLSILTEIIDRSRDVVFILKHAHISGWERDSRAVGRYVYNISARILRIRNEYIDKTFFLFIFLFLLFIYFLFFKNKKKDNLDIFHGMICLRKKKLSEKTNFD